VYLRKLILHGFKSFADRTEFEFGPGRTGIVGPNGCGKSNVLDAIRWVLGEQSAKTLRGASMQDVVFSGSRTRKPAPFAEVELVIDNQDGGLPSPEPEVIISRTLLRDGGSEYRINGETSRLKDIRDMLLDTGMGVEAYSVIQQGQVDAMLKGNPLDRREIFEEAAGISRYKVRRTEAQRKLERTQNNLLRLNDVIEELERRLRSVKLAAGKARNFQEYDEQLRALRASFSLAEYHALEISRKRLAAQASALADVVRAHRASLAERDAAGAALEQGLRQIDERTGAAQQALYELQTRAATVDEQISHGRRRIEELREAHAAHGQRAAEAATLAGELTARAAEEQAALDELVAAEAREAERVANLSREQQESERSHSTSRTRFEGEREAAFDTARRATVVRNESENLAAQAGRLAAQQARLGEREAELADEGAALSERRAGVVTRLGEADERSAALTRDLEAADSEIAALQAELTRLDGELAERRETRSAAQSRLALLTEMESRLEGVDLATRQVLEWRSAPDSAGGVVGLVADVLDVADERLALIQPLLAGIENRIVVERLDEFLAAARRHGELPGVIDVIALDRLPAAPPDDESRGWVRCEERYRPLAHALLGRLSFCGSADDALAATPLDSGRFRVSRDGLIVAAYGSVTLGSQKKAPGLISRKAEIRRLSAELDDIEAALLHTTRARREAEAAISDRGLQRKGLLDAVATAQRSHAELRTELLRLDDQTSRLARERQIIDSEKADLARQAARIDERTAALDRQHADLCAAQETHEVQIRALQEELNSLSAAVRRVAEELTAAQIGAGRAAERRGAREAALRELSQRVEALGRDRQRAVREQEEAAGRIAQAEVELAAAAEGLAALRAGCVERETVLDGLRAERDQGRRLLEACAATVRRLHGDVEAADAALRECEVERRECEIRAEGLVARVAEDLSIDLAAAYAEYAHEDRDWEAVRAEIESLRAKISRLGNVNLDAIRELEELSPRFESLTAQRADLVTSVSSLEKLITELDEESRARFERTFTDIRDNFRELFRKLFGGGKADIVLEDPERPLETGIEIIARPPGKEARRISLLSGGERTMAAVALLFAVFRSKPSPFTILDEVDAALDESNIDRFNSMVDEFLDQSQFVIITHNKRTMQRADVLYGVTMEEPGVSKRVSVRFDQSVETPARA